MSESKINKLEGAAPVPRVYKTKEAAAMWGLSYWTLRRMVLKGMIRPIRGVGKGWYFKASQLDDVEFEHL